MPSSGLIPELLILSCHWISNSDIRAQLGTSSVGGGLDENILRWFWHASTGKFCRVMLKKKKKPGNCEDQRADWGCGGLMMWS